MSAVWWGKEAGAPRAVRIAADGVQPELAASSRKAVFAELRARVASYTPEWTRFQRGDPGFALTQLFSEQMEPVVRRLNRLPEKALVEFLGMAGVSPLPPTPAKVEVEFEISDAAPASVSIGAGFQIGARAAGGGDMVVFETERPLLAAPATISETHVQVGTTASAIKAGEDPATSRFLPFGAKPGPSSALLIGLAGEAEELGPTLSLGIGIAAAPGTPPPVSAGGIAPLPVPPPPVLQWEVLDSTSFVPAEIDSDGTAGLTRSGVVELRVPRRWRKGRPPVLDAGDALRWLRLRIAHGTYSYAPALSFIALNVVSAIAARTVRDEVLQPIAGSGNRRWVLSQTPVMAGSLGLFVDEGGLDEELGNESDEDGSLWREVADLGESSAEDRHYVLDHAAGIVTFGDGTQGRAVPSGFRHVRALSYQAGGGSAGAVDAGAASTLLSSAPYVTGVKNRLPASGGTDRESQSAAVRRGPQEIRARGRAVTLADYELLAARAPGAQVVRAHAVAGLHPAYPGLPIPGVVGVFVVTPDRNEGAPTPDEMTLRAVAEHLAQAAPAGIDVVAAAPRYHRVRVEVGIVIDAGANAAETVRTLNAELSRYLHPLAGGDDGAGWGFGAPLVYSTLLRLATAVDGVHAVERLNLVVDGVRTAACHDYPISAHGLLWPDVHQVVIVAQEKT